jgi:hypothetical protein
MAFLPIEDMIPLKPRGPLHTNITGAKGDKRTMPSNIVTDSAIKSVPDPELVDHAAIFSNYLPVSRINDTWFRDLNASEPYFA